MREEEVYLMTQRIKADTGAEVYMIAHKDNRELPLYLISSDVRFTRKEMEAVKKTLGIL